MQRSCIWSARVDDQDKTLRDHASIAPRKTREADGSTAVTIDRQPVLAGELVELRLLREDDFSALRAIAADPLLWEQHPSKDRVHETVFRAWFDATLASEGASSDLRHRRMKLHAELRKCRFFFAISMGPLSIESAPSGAGRRISPLGLIKMQRSLSGWCRWITTD